RFSWLKNIIYVQKYVVDYIYRKIYFSTFALVKVECRDASVRQILELLRSGSGRDINVRDDGSCREITAAFSPADTAPGKLEQILQHLNDMSGVLHVDIVENP